MLNSQTRKNLQDVIKSARELVSTIASRLRNRYIEKNGKFCPKCNGKKYVVTWDTMDVMDGGCHQTATCPNPNCNADKTLADPTKRDKYDNFHENVRWADFTSVATDKELAQQIANIEAVLNAKKSLKNAEESAEPKIGNDATLLKRLRTDTKNNLGPVEIDTVGRIFWIGTVRLYGSRVGIEFLNGDKRFCSADYVEGVVPVGV